jgi:flagellar protein FliO/FliZ
VTWWLLAQTDAASVAGPELMPNVWRMLGALAVVVGLLAGLAWLLRRGVMARRKTGALGVESALSLGERRSLVVVSVEGRRLLLGLAPNHVSLVTELQRLATFDQVLAQAVEPHASGPEPLSAGAPQS